jgi:Zn-finger nucleic acid-binding protein
MAESTTTLTCPKCGGEMRTYERSGIVVDQCTECRGVFLDRGELERMIDAEAGHYGDGAPAAAAPEPERYEEQRREEPQRRKKRGFLSDMFEFGGD